MEKSINKTNNYFEPNRIVRQAQNYRHNFIDYLYFQGEQYEKKWATSCSGSIMVSWYWGGIVCFPTFLVFLPEFINTLNPLVIVFLAFIGLQLPPTLWCMFRYKKERVAAIQHHFCQSAWSKISIWWILLFPALVIIATAIFVITTSPNSVIVLNNSSCW